MKILKIAWADLKNQNKRLFKNKKKYEHGLTSIVKLVCDKDIVAAA